MDKFIIKKGEIVLVLYILFGSCDTPLYNYYYSTLKADNPNILYKTKPFFTSSKLNGGNYSYGWIKTTWGDKDSIFWEVKFSGEYLTVYCDNKIPVYFDFQNSSVNLNDSSYRIIPENKEKESILELSKYKRQDNFGFIEFPFQMVNHIYDKYDENQYVEKLYLFEDKGLKNNHLGYSIMYTLEGRCSIGYI